VLIESTPARDAETLRHALIVTSLIQVTATAIALALTPIAPRAALDFGVGAHLVGYQISLIYFAGAIGSATAGTLLHRFGAVRIENVALALFALGLALLATASLPVAIFASLLIGFGYGIQNPASSQILGRVSPPHRRNIIFSIKQAGVPIGAVVASFCFPLLDKAVGWRAAFPVLALLPLMLIWHLMRAHRDERHDYRGGPSLLRGLMEEQKLVWGRGELRILSLLGLLYSAAQLSLSAFIVLMLVDTDGWPLIEAGAVAGVVQLFGAGGRVFWGWLADHAGSGFAILSFIGIASTAGMLALPWLPGMATLVQIALLCALGFCLSGWNGVAMAEIARFSPIGQTGRVMGGALVYTFLGVMMGPSSFAVIYEHVRDYAQTFAIISVATGLGGVAAALMAMRVAQARRV